MEGGREGRNIHGWIMYNGRFGVLALELTVREENDKQTMIHNVVVPWLLLEAVKRCFRSHCVVLKGMMMIMMMCCILGFLLLRGGACQLLEMR